jgi:hypothetical protein
MLPRLAGFCHDGSEGAPCADGGDILTETVCARVAPSVLPDAALVWFIARNWCRRRGDDGEVRAHHHSEDEGGISGSGKQETEGGSYFPVF